MDCIKYPTEKLLEILVQEEEELRQSEWYRQECTRVKDVPNGWLEVTAKMQKDLVRKHGFEDEISCDIACNMLRRARYIYPDNKIFWEVPVYVRNNLAKPGDLKEGDLVPNIKIYNKVIEEVNLLDLMKTDKLTLVLGSSHT